MLTLDDIKEYYDKGYITLRIDPYFSKEKFGTVKKGSVWGLNREQIEEVLIKKTLTIESTRKVLFFDIAKRIPVKVTRACALDVGKDLHLAISIERNGNRVSRSQWEKIKKQMREAGFSYRSESPWFCTFTNGQWDC